MAAIIFRHRSRRPPRWPMRLRENHPLCYGLQVFCPLTTPGFYVNLVTGERPGGVMPLPTAGNQRRKFRTAGRNGAPFHLATTFSGAQYLTFPLQISQQYGWSIATEMVAGSGSAFANSTYTLALCQDSGADSSHFAFGNGSGGVVASSMTSGGVSSTAVQPEPSAGEAIRYVAAFESDASRILYADQLPPASNATARASTAPTTCFIGARWTGSAVGGFIAGSLAYGAAWNIVLDEVRVREFNENPWQILARDRGRVYFFPAGGGTAQDLEGAAAASATAQGTLSVTTSHALAGAADAGAQASAALAVTKVLAGAAAASSAATGAATVAKPIAGTAQVGAQASGGLNITTNLAGAAVASGAASGQLAIAVVLNGAAVAAAIASGALTVDGPGLADLDGAATAGGQASGALSVGKPLAGAAQASSIASGTLSLVARLSGAAVAGGQGSATLSLSVRLSGAAIASTLAGGTLTVLSLSMNGTAVARATASGSLSLAVKLSGAAVAKATATGVLSGTAIARLEYRGGGRHLHNVDRELEARVREGWDRIERKRAERKALINLVALIARIDEAS
jgi:hypothetical protein